MQEKQNEFDSVTSDSEVCDKYLVNWRAGDFFNLSTYENCFLPNAKYKSQNNKRLNLLIKLKDSVKFLENDDRICLKCILEIDHTICRKNKFIRVGGGYRHSYYYIQMLLKKLEKEKDLMESLNCLLPTIDEENDEHVAIRTYIRNSKGELVEKIVYIKRKDYDKMLSGEGDKMEILKKYLSKHEQNRLEGFDEEEVVPTVTYIRTKSGRIKKVTAFVSKSDYDKMMENSEDAHAILQKYLKLEEGDVVQDFDKEQPTVVKTLIRTKSGRLIEKDVILTKDEYEALQNGTLNLEDIMKQQGIIGENDKVEAWKAKPPTKKKEEVEHTVTATIRTKSGRFVKKKISLTEEEAKALKEGKITIEEIMRRKKMLNDDEKIIDWKQEKTVRPKKQKIHNTVTATIRTKSGRFVQKKISLTEEEAKALEEGKITIEQIMKNRNLLKDDEKIVKWKQKAVTEAEREEKKRRKMEKEKDKKLVTVTVRTKSGRLIKKEIIMTAEEYNNYLNSEDPNKMIIDMLNLGDDVEILNVSKKSITKVDPQKYGDLEVLSSFDGDNENFETLEVFEKDGELFEVVIDKKTGKKYLKKIDKNNIVESKEVQKNKKALQRKKEKEKLKNMTKEKFEKYMAGGRQSDSESDFSYESYVGADGKRHVKRKKKVKGKDGKVIGYETEDDSYHSSADEMGKMRRTKRRLERLGQEKQSGDSSSSDEVLKIARKAIKTKIREKLGLKTKRVRRIDSKGNSYYSSVTDSSEDYTGLTEEEIKKKKYEKKIKKKLFQIQSGIVNTSDSETDSEWERQYLEGLTAEEKEKYFRDKKTRQNIRKEKQEIRDKKKEKIFDKLKELKREKKRQKGLASDDDSSSLDSETEREFLKRLNSDERRIYFKEKEKKQKKKEEKIREEAIKKEQQKAREAQEESEMRSSFETRRKQNEEKKKSRRSEHASVRDKIARALRNSKIDMEIKLSTESFDNIPMNELLNHKKFFDIVNYLQKSKGISGGRKEISDFIKKLVNTVTHGENESCSADGDMSILAHYKLVDHNKVEKYAKGFITENLERKPTIDGKATMKAITNLFPQLEVKQKDYIMKILKIENLTPVCFRKFAVIAAVSERVTQMEFFNLKFSSYCQDLIKICECYDIERKMSLYYSLFYCNCGGIFNPNYITAGSLRIELIAGGLTGPQQRYILRVMNPNKNNEISFLDYITYIPLFLSIHERIWKNPFDFSFDFYSEETLRPISGRLQKDCNPLDFPLSRSTKVFQSEYGKIINDKKSNKNASLI